VVPALLVLATFNAAKARELSALLAGVPFTIRPLRELSAEPLPAEGAESYRANALLKARDAARRTGALALADDSGLEVDALGGAPGVVSARYGGPDLDDAGRYRRLLAALAGVPPARRTARFRAVIAIVEPTGAEHVVEGLVEGTIAPAPRGAGGFGYDPVFFYPPLGRTFGELSEEEKGLISHRARAAAAARAVLRDLAAIG
jgi:XTP/dITP diphosphohydrolase